MKKNENESYYDKYLMIFGIIMGWITGFLLYDKFGFTLRLFLCIGILIITAYILLLALPDYLEAKRRAKEKDKQWD